MARIVAYIRVSSTAKADQEDSVPEQKRKLNSWANRSGHVIVGWYSDEGVSGGNALDARRALPEAMGALRDGTADGLVVVKLDRLARDLIVQVCGRDIHHRAREARHQVLADDQPVARSAAI
jgi:DNA invertase Pin-like site-specific DNA recombinase